MKYAIHRITNTESQMGRPKQEAELRQLVGETITAKGIGGENAFRLFRYVLVKATVPIDHPRHWPSGRPRPQGPPSCLIW